MSEPIFCIHLWGEIAKLKNLNANSDPKFIVDRTPFDGLDDDEVLEAASAIGKEHVIIGRILPDLEIYKDNAYQIEIKLKPKFPIEPPEIRFLTKIYHPNISKHSAICNERLAKTVGWNPIISLVEVVRAVTLHIDEPDIDYAMSFDVGLEYVKRKSEFNRKAAEYVKQYTLPRP